MKISKKLVMGLATGAVIATAGIGSAYAATTIGSVTGKDGDVKDKVAMQAEVVDSSGSHLTIKDSETGDTYETSVGPSWYSGSYSTGDQVSVEGVVTTGDNENGHTFQTTKINDTVLRDEFEGKPNWAGQRGNSDGNGIRNGAGSQNRGANFTDANGDGVCDNR